MQEAEVVLGNHRAAVLSKACNFERRPDGVAGEELVVALDAGKADHAELHDDVVNELLSLLLGEDAVLDVALDVDVQEGRDAADGHGGTVLRLDGGKIAEVEPLEGFCGVLCGLGDVKAVGSGHFLDLSESLDLLGDFLAQADHVIGHRSVTDVVEVLLLGSNQEVDSIEGNTAVVADDASAAIGIRQTGQDVG